MDFPDKNIIIFLNCNQLQPIFLFSHTLICTETNVFGHMPAEAGRKSIFNVLCVFFFTILKRVCELNLLFKLKTFIS